MNEYQVKMKAVIPGLFPQVFEGIEIFSASSAQQAIELAEEDFKANCIGVDLDEISFSVVDVKRI